MTPRVFMLFREILGDYFLLVLEFYFIGVFWYCIFDFLWWLQFKYFFFIFIFDISSTAYTECLAKGNLLTFLFCYFRIEIFQSYFNDHLLSLFIEKSKNKKYKRFLNFFKVNILKWKEHQLRLLKSGKAWIREKASPLLFRWNNFLIKIWIKST